MLYFSQCHKSSEKGHLVTDVTFTLADIGLTHIEDPQSVLNPLTGEIYDEHTTIKINDEFIDFANEKGRSQYRKDHLVCFDQVSERLTYKNILENITLFYHDKKEDIHQAIQLFDLKDHIYEPCEEASTQTIAKMICCRIYLRGSKILLLNTKKNDHTKEEYEQLAPYLIRLSSYMQVIVIGDKISLPYDREISISQGRILADNGYQERVMKVQKETSLLPNKAFTLLMKRMHTRYSFLYHVLLVLLMISFFLVSILLSGNTLQIENIQLSMLKRDNKSSFEIKRYLNDEYGQIYQIDDLITKQQLEELPLDQKNMICSYRPINAYYANCYLEGIYEEAQAPIYNQYDICELHNVKQLEASQIVGRFPETFDEVMMSYQLASTFFEYSPQGMIGQKLRWYGLNLTISGVFLDKNVQNDQNFYTLIGFMDHHPLSLMKIFAYGEKHLYTSDHHVYLNDYRELSPVSIYHNGKKTVYASALKENEVVIDLATAIELGFPYDEICGNPNLSYEKKLKAYYEFVKTLIGTEVYLRVDRIPSSGIDTSYYQEDKIIAGTLIPNMNTMHKVASIKPKVLYFKKGNISNYLGKNFYMTKVQYHSTNDSVLKHALKYFESNDIYYPDLNNALLLRLLVSDISELSLFFTCMFIGFGLLTLLLYYALMKKTLYHNRHELQLMYGFGASKSMIKKALSERFLNKMKHYFFISLLVSILILWIYYFVIFIKLSRDITIFIYLIIPVIIYIIYGGIIIGITKLYMNYLFRRG